MPQHYLCHVSRPSFLNTQQTRLKSSRVVTDDVARNGGKWRVLSACICQRHRYLSTLQLQLVALFTTEVFEHQS